METIVINYNKISNNSAPKGGGIYIHGHPTINYNDIYDNTFFNAYNSNEAGTANVNATYNWWGTTNETEIQAHIYDWYDDASLGIMDYIPYLMEPVTPAPTISIATEKFE